MMKKTQSQIHRRKTSSKGIYTTETHTSSTQSSTYKNQYRYIPRRFDYLNSRFDEAKITECLRNEILVLLECEEPRPEG
nr:hypothetical protein Iba_chr05aCG8890 [Ipomoea batatas]GMC93895.1 hypothetical protein Iba_chr05bCG6770 [Ipomoea batatas]GMC97755.1 hypothetical protein Iba_chr05dCG10050 [Ipomoea batatas]GME03111.1 hypothetical protein Iba_scaffold446CG0590 [Ipomoea batatas]